MKNQNDLIVSISFGLIGLIFAIIFMVESPTVSKPADPTPVPTDKAKLPVVAVTYADSLPGGSSSTGRSGFGGGAPGMGAGRGMPPGMPGGMGMGGPGAMGGKPRLTPRAGG